MLEVELKAVVEDAAGTRKRLEAAGATLQFAGRMEDRRYDTPDGRFARRDVVIRLRVYRASDGAVPEARLDWKGASSSDSGYKIRDELSTMVGDAVTLATILDRLGFIVTREVDRQIWQYKLGPAMVRFEQYPRMDVLLEVEGSPEAIERAIGTTGIPRSHFSDERLLDFVARFEERTGLDAALSDRELANA
ncbi:MAG TPA: class IV adenylate cyclase [Gemmatimonadaceae bacterium]|nr:class IV adenylate cyclase [Gemmatimonadaceae bacterium]